MYAHIFLSSGLSLSTLPPLKGKNLWYTFPTTLIHFPHTTLQEESTDEMNN